MTGVTRHRPLSRWQRKLASKEVRSVACVGDSITYAPSMRKIGVTRSWVDQLASALEASTGLPAGDGFRGLWRDDEWTCSGQWIAPEPNEPFDVAPFRRGLYSSGNDDDEITWTKPEALTVRGFDIFSIHTPTTGPWQYRVDDGVWTTAAPSVVPSGEKLRPIFVGERVERRVAVRGHNGSAPCAAALAGIATYSTPSSDSRVVVHNLGHQEKTLAEFARASGGDALAVLDVLAPDLLIVMFSNDVTFRDPDRFAGALRRVIDRVSSRADVLLIAPFEQRPPRFVTDAVTLEGSRVVISRSANFLTTDTGTGVRGSHIPRGAKISSVQSDHQVTISVPALASSNSCSLMIGGRRDRRVQATYRAFTRAVAEADGCAFLNLADAWQEKFGAGWEGAEGAGLMYDGLHPNQEGHDEIARLVTAALGIA